jgi:hypothetical protein
MSLEIRERIDPNSTRKVLPLVSNLLNSARTYNFECIFHVPNHGGQENFNNLNYSVKSISLPELSFSTNRMGTTGNSVVLPTGLTVGKLKISFYDTIVGGANHYINKLMEFSGRYVIFVFSLGTGKEILSITEYRVEGISDIKYSEFDYSTNGFRTIDVSFILFGDDKAVTVHHGIFTGTDGKPIIFNDDYLLSLDRHLFDETSLGGRARDSYGRYVDIVPK